MIFFLPTVLALWPLILFIALMVIGFPILSGRVLREEYFRLDWTGFYFRRENRLQKCNGFLPLDQLRLVFSRIFCEPGDEDAVEHLVLLREDETEIAIRLDQSPLAAQLARFCTDAESLRQRLQQSSPEALPCTDPCSDSNEEPKELIQRRSVSRQIDDEEMPSEYWSAVPDFCTHLIRRYCARPGETRPLISFTLMFTAMLVFLYFSAFMSAFDSEKMTFSLRRFLCPLLFLSPFFGVDLLLIYQIVCGLTAERFQTHYWLERDGLTRQTTCYGLHGRKKRTFRPYRAVDVAASERLWEVRLIGDDKKPLMVIKDLSFSEAEKLQAIIIQRYPTTE